MTNFEKFKQDLTVERLVNMLTDTYYEMACVFCAYNSVSCIEDCEYGIKKWLESEVEI